jgi:hypothetical protein
MMLLASALSLGMVAASSADLVTTELALRRPGLREANPMLSQPIPRYGLKLLGTAAALGVRHELQRRGKHEAAKWFGIGVVILFAGAATNNVIQARRH